MGDQLALNTVLDAMRVEWRRAGRARRDEPDALLAGSAGSAPHGLRVELLPLQVAAINVERLPAAQAAAFRRADAYVVHAKQRVLAASGLWWLRADWRQALAGLDLPEHPPRTMPGAGATQRLARLVDRQHAFAANATARRERVAGRQAHVAAGKEGGGSGAGSRHEAHRCVRKTNHDLAFAGCLAWCTPQVACGDGSPPGQHGVARERVAPARTACASCACCACAGACTA